MAIKVNGTTVIDDSRNLANVGGLKTVNGTSLVGSGNISAGASTSYNAVGTYAYLFYDGATTEGTTRAGSSLYPGAVNNWQSLPADGSVGGFMIRGGTSVSGTWRLMGRNNSSSEPRFLSVWVRIS